MGSVTNSGSSAVWVVALRNSGKEVEGGKLDLARCTASLVLGSHKRAIQSGCICPHLNGFPLDNVLVDD